MSGQKKVWDSTIWEFNKTQSNWHYDKTIPPTLGKDSFTPICIFEYDFTKEIELCLASEQSCMTTFTSLNIFSNNENVKALFNGADPKTEVFNRIHAYDIPVFRLINDYLGLKESAIFFHNQTTGQMAPLHLDNFGSRGNEENVYDVDYTVITDEDMLRMVVMLADWEPGQSWLFGNLTYTGWKAGTCFTWDWKNMPHGTVNAGWAPRPMLQITGIQTLRTKQILQAAEQNLGLPLPKIAI